MNRHLTTSVLLIYSVVAATGALHAVSIRLSRFNERVDGWITAGYFFLFQSLLLFMT